MGFLAVLANIPLMMTIFRFWADFVMQKSTFLEGMKKCLTPGAVIVVFPKKGYSETELAVKNDL
jgi:hypothetical protein